MKKLYFHLFLSLFLGVLTLINGTYKFCDILSCKTYYNATTAQFAWVIFSLIYLSWVLFSFIQKWLFLHHDKKEGLVMNLENKIYDVQSKDI